MYKKGESETKIRAGELETKSNNYGLTHLLPASSLETNSEWAADRPDYAETFSMRLWRRESGTHHFVGRQNEHRCLHYSHFVQQTHV